MKSTDLFGIHVAAVTPFTPGGAVDFDSFRNLTQQFVRAGVRGVLVNGTTGESSTVDWSDAEQLTRIAREECRGKALVIVGTGTNDTASTVEQTQRARELNADAALVVVPYFNRPAQAGIVEHFRRVAAVGLPIICYNIPYRTAVALDSSTLRAILELEGVAGVKEATGGLANTIELATWCKKAILCGEDALVFPSMCCGGSGGILAAANVHTEEYVRMYEELARGEFAAARKRYLRLYPLIKLLFEEPNPGPVKWLLANQGVIASPAQRLPLVDISEGLKMRLGLGAKLLVSQLTSDRS